jgi:hypothetical protein
VGLVAPDALGENPNHLLGFSFLTNLAARLYPRTRITAPKNVHQSLSDVVLGINPECELDFGDGSADARIAWCQGSDILSVGPAAWTVSVNSSACGTQSLPTTNPLTALAAGAIGSSELFRVVFALSLPEAKRTCPPYRIQLLDNDEVLLPERIHIGRVHLAGAGAIGQAFLSAMAALNVTGELVVYDPEQVTLSNLQRYVLTRDDDVGLSKCALAARALAQSSVRFHGLESAWGTVSAPDAEVVCAALDSAVARIGVQASLPRSIYNAWTQPLDLGWSRHEHFGDDPCLACLYWPTGSRPSQHVQIARALRQPELRILAYLINRVPVDAALVPTQVPQLPEYETSANLDEWCERSLLEDLAALMGVPPRDLSSWKGKQLGDLYREGICGGAIVGGRIGEVPVDVTVPLAHQSAFAGVMLALQLITATAPELRRARVRCPEGRVDLTSSPPRFVFAPRQRTPGCLCGDDDFGARYREKWASPGY